MGHDVAQLRQAVDRSSSPRRRSARATTTDGAHRGRTDDDPAGTRSRCVAHPWATTALMVSACQTHTIVPARVARPQAVGGWRPCARLICDELSPPGNRRHRGCTLDRRPLRSFVGCSAHGRSSSPKSHSNSPGTTTVLRPTPWPDRRTRSSFARSAVSCTPQQLLAECHDPLHGDLGLGATLVGRSRPSPGRQGRPCRSSAFSMPHQRHRGRGSLRLLFVVPCLRSHGEQSTLAASTQPQRHRRGPARCARTPRHPCGRVSSGPRLVDVARGGHGREAGVVPRGDVLGADTVPGFGRSRRVLVLRLAPAAHGADSHRPCLHRGSQRRRFFRATAPTTSPTDRRRSRSATGSR